MPADGTSPYVLDKVPVHLLAKVWGFMTHLLQVCILLRAKGGASAARKAFDFYCSPILERQMSTAESA